MEFYKVIQNTVNDYGKIRKKKKSVYYKSSEI